jgi:hypothetical protein
MYSQTSDAEAAAGTNYPVPYAGFMEVLNAGGSLIKQKYTANRNADQAGVPSIWERINISAVWSAWVPIFDDSGYNTTISSIVTAATGWTVASAIARRINKQAFLRITFTRTGAAIAVADSASSTPNTDCGTVLAAWRPSGQTQVLVQGSDRLAAFTLNTSGVINLFANAPSFNIATNDQVNAAGVYFL